MAPEGVQKLSNSIEIDKINLSLIARNGLLITLNQLKKQNLNFYLLASFDNFTPGGSTLWSQPADHRLPLHQWDDRGALTNRFGCE